LVYLNIKTYTQWKKCNLHSMKEVQLTLNEGSATYTQWRKCNLHSMKELQLTLNEGNATYTQWCRCAIPNDTSWFETARLFLCGYNIYNNYKILLKYKNICLYNKISMIISVPTSNACVPFPQMPPYYSMSEQVFELINYWIKERTTD